MEKQWNNPRVERSIPDAGQILFFRMRVRSFVPDAGQIFCSACDAGQILCSGYGSDPLFRMRVRSFVPDAYQILCSGCGSHPLFRSGSDPLFRMRVRSSVSGCETDLMFRMRVRSFVPQLNLIFKMMPVHPDPNLDPQHWCNLCCGSVTFWFDSGSRPLTNGSGSRSCYFRP
jgi:hypothetical protein